MIKKSEKTKDGKQIHAAERLHLNSESETNASEDGKYKFFCQAQGSRWWACCIWGDNSQKSTEASFPVKSD